MPEVSFSISTAEERRINELLAALRSNVDVSWDKKSFYLNDVFIEEFQSRLLSQHVFLGTPLFQENFDRAFIASAECAGLEVVEAVGGQRFWDVRIGNRNLSLKSSKAKSLRKDRLHISKLTEAAWIQDCRSAKLRRDHTFDLFRSYCEEVDEIIQLRYFQKTRTYEIVGIPVKILQKVLDLPVSAFNADGPTINIPIGQEIPDFTLKLDRSDAKITLANINKAVCKVHANWVLR
ncbi:MAG: hypothetical protein P1U89_02300 [Verrucomicrobiales bacterium]|nr:hypothetical protein [Verrucomicrobiales bacterium]